MSEGPAVVFVHGIRTSRTMWRGQLSALASIGIPASAVDLPGHGRLVDTEFTVERAVAVIDHAVHDAGRPVLLVGLSLGGYLSLHYAARHPGDLLGVMAASCSALPRRVLVGGYAALAAGIHRLPDRGRRLNDALARLALAPTAVDDLLSGGIALDVMASGLRAVGTLDPVDDLRAIRRPVWLVNGDLDHFRIDERRMLAACTDGRVIRIPGATHLVNLARPVEFTATVIEAVRELSGERRELPLPA